MLTASYGLLLHGSGRARVRSGLHSIAINLMASSLFLIGVAILYGVTGTLNLADMAIMVPAIAEDDRGLLHAGAAILAVAFLVKAAAWPLNFWLSGAYTSAAAPVAALFAVMTKLGAYAVLRVWTLLFSPGAGVSALLGGPVLVDIGLVTLALGAVGVVSAQHLGRMVAFCAIASSGPLLAALGFGEPAVTGGALYYMLGSTLAISAFFLLAELIDRTREVEEQPLDISEEEPADAFAYPVDLLPAGNVNLDDDEQALIGRAIPAATAFLGLAFIGCALTIAGLPPLAGFIGKVVMLSALLNPAGLGGQAGVSGAAWALLALLVVSGLLMTIALSRAGSRYFWAAQSRPLPRLRIIETLPVAALLLLVCALVWQADAVLRYTNAAAQSLHDPHDYISAVMAARPVPAPGGQQPR
jgi:multicomponent K+:H+ antiporter subunit D